MPSEEFLAREFRIHVRKPLLLTLRAMHRRSGGTIPFESFLGELIETAAADFRRVTCEPSPNECPMLPIGAVVAPRETHRLQLGRNRKITRAETIEAILDLRTQGHSLREIGQRYGIGISTVARILANGGAANDDDTDT